MWLFNFFAKKRADGNFQTEQASDKPQLQAFILEPILTPSSITPNNPWEGGDRASDCIEDLTTDPIPESDLPEPASADLSLDSPLDVDIPDNELEPIPFIHSNEQLDGYSAEPLATFAPSYTFDSGVFTVGTTGTLSIELLFDGGAYQGELAIFSLESMEQYEPGCEDFIRVAAQKALSQSAEGYIVISDPSEAAKFSGSFGENDWNTGVYLGEKSFVMNPGTHFGFMLVPNGTVQQLLDNPNAGGALRPLFSMGTANPNDVFHVGQIADITGEGNVFVMEDLRVDHHIDRDYNDLIFQVKGATGEAVQLDEVINPAHDWRDSQLGQELRDYLDSAPTNPNPIDPNPIDPGDPSPSLNYEPSRLLVKFEADVTNAEIEAIAINYGATGVESFQPLNRSTSSSFSQWRVVQLSPDVDKLLRSLIVYY